MFAIFSRRKKNVERCTVTRTPGKQQRKTVVSSPTIVKPEAKLLEPRQTPSVLPQKETGLADKITVITVNFKTPDLTFDAVTTFKAFYPDLLYILVDNGGCSKSLALGKRMAAKDWIHFISNSRNVGHGLALNQGLAMVETPYAFLLDSDTKTERGGFLEKMLLCLDETVFAAGWLRYVNSSGVARRNNREGAGSPYIHPYACLLDTEKFRNLHPFTDSNAPATKLMASAVAANYKLLSFPVEDYIWHKVSGTRGLFGGDCHPATNRQPGEWHKRRI